MFTTSVSLFSLGLMSSGSLIAEEKTKELTLKLGATEHIELNVEAHETTRISVTSNRSQYIRGTFSYDGDLASIKVYRSDQSLSKSLFNRVQARNLQTRDTHTSEPQDLTIHSSQKRIEEEIYLYLQHADTYSIEVKAGNKASNVQFSLRDAPLKEDRVVNPSEPILSPRLKRLQNAIDDNETSAEERFWTEIEAHGTPLIEPQSGDEVLLTFLWKGDVNNVRLLGAPYDGHAHLSRMENSKTWYKSYRVPKDFRLSYQVAPYDGHAHLSRMENSKTWYKSYRVPKDFRLSYQVAPNMPRLESPQGWEQRRAILATLQADPNNLNPWPVPEEGRVYSTIESGNPPSAHWLDGAVSQQGKLTHHTFSSELLGNSRKISIYRPFNDQELNADTPLLILFDGDAFLDKGLTPFVLDALIEAGELAPMRAVFVNNPSRKLRGTELPPNPEFAKMMATELMPWLAKHHEILPNSEQVVLSGASYGGLASLYIAHQYPDVFGKVLSQSGSFWWSHEDAEWLTKQISQSPHKPIQVYLNAGLFEVKPDFANILGTNRNMHQVLKDKGYQVMLKEFASGHDYFSWRITLVDGLKRLFPMPVK
ncbi:alpha/beta hydrolase-fold protein [Vibrio sp. vnigr-6D03]|uniref:alpha/beta hydrolase-fold protein n=1 Tax=Vibrio sp. vnigr-6D03 TaxID=2058088 RepID=UPI001EED8E06|nr:alpha/beta hydrolase-fold protein [Vibrio sp. vnigr-6D03]